MTYKYYKTKHARLSPSDVFVYLGGNGLYCPVGQHGQMNMSYFISNTKEISREQYIKTSGELYTPEEYLQ